MLDLIAWFLHRLVEDAVGSATIDLFHDRSVSVLVFGCEAASLAAIAVVIERVTRFARSNVLFRLFLYAELMIFIGAPLGYWIWHGADLNDSINYVLLSSWHLLLSPWIFVAALSPLLFIVIPLRDQFLDLGGSTVGWFRQFLCLMVMMALCWRFNLVPYNSSWPLHAVFVALLLEALLPAYSALVIYAAFRRLQRHGVMGRGVVRSKGGESIWGRSHELTDRDLRRIHASFKAWRNSH